MDDTENDTRDAETSQALLEAQLKYCGSLLTKLKRNPNASPFLRPVDPVALGIPDYPEKIKQPMDISTVKHRLDTRAYGTTDAFHSDMELMFSNCFAYNHSDSVVYKMGADLQRAFEALYKDLPTDVPKKAGTGLTSPGPSGELKRRKTERRDSPLSEAGSPQSRRPEGAKTRMGDDEFTRCSEVLADLEKQKHRKFSWPFLYPVTETDAPGYFDVIKHPMDLATIRTKLEARKYATFQDFAADISLMIENCFTFNSPDSEVAKCGTEFNRLFISLAGREKDPDARITELRKRISALTQELRALEQASKGLFTLEDRERIGKAIVQMSKAQTEKVAEIVHRHCAYEYVDNDEIEINLQTMPDEVVAEIDDFIQKTRNGDEASSASDD